MIDDSHSDRPGVRFVPPLVYLCFLLSGVAGLIYSVLWEKSLSGYMGATSWVQALILSLFMLGLAAGSAVFGRVADRITNHLQTYALLELGIAVLAMIEVLLIHPAYGTLGAMGRAGAWSPLTHKLLQATLAGALIFPLTFMMGGTLPLLGRARLVTAALRERHLAFLYFFNSLGAALGAFATGYLLIPRLGLSWTMAGGALLNLIAGLSALFLHRLLFRRAVQTVESQPAPSAPSLSVQAGEPVFPWRLALPVAALGGLLSFALEIAWIRMLSNVLGASTYSFSVMVGTFIFGIAAGSWLAGRLYRRWPYWKILVAAQTLLLVSLLVLLPVFAELPFAFLELRSLLSRSPAAFPLYEGMKFVLCFAVMIVPTLCLGAFLPTLTSAVPAGGGNWGRRIGFIYAANTAGTVFGAAAAGLVVLPALGFDNLIRLVIAGETVQLLLLAVGFGSLRRRERLQLAAVGLAALFLLVATPPLNERNFTLGLFRGDPAERLEQNPRILRDNRQVHLFRDDPAATIAVYEDRRTKQVSFSIGAKPDGSTSKTDRFTQYVTGLYGNLLLEHPRRVAVIGLGTGMTAAAILRNPLVEELVVIEIARTVATDEFQSWFREYNDDALNDPRTTLVIDDARSYFERNSEPFDLIVSEPSNPWIAGIGNIFSREFFALAREQLTEEGMYVLWTQLYESNTDVTDTIVRTVADVFEHYSLWIASHNASNLAILATRGPLTLDFDRFENRVASPNYRDLLQTLQVETPLAFLLLQLATDTQAQAIVGDGPLNRLDRPVVEYRAPRAFFVGEVDDYARFDRRRSVNGIAELYAGRYLAENRVDATQLLHTLDRSGRLPAFEPLRGSMIELGQRESGFDESFADQRWAHEPEKDLAAILARYREWDGVRAERQSWFALLELMRRVDERRASGLYCPDLEPLAQEMIAMIEVYGHIPGKDTKSYYELFVRCGQRKTWDRVSAKLNVQLCQGLDAEVDAVLGFIRSQGPLNELQFANVIPLLTRCQRFDLLRLLREESAKAAKAQSP